MGTGELGRTEAAEAEDGRRPARSEASPSPEHPGDTQPRAPDASQETKDQEPGGPDQEPAETQTRDDYADSMRGQGAPIPPEDDSSQDDTHDQEEQHSPAGEPREDTSGHDQGEPRDRETYADDMRHAEPIDAGLESTPDRDDGQGDATSGTSSSPDNLGPSGIEHAESRSREEYANDMREGGDPLAADTQQPGGGDPPADLPEAAGDDHPAAEDARPDHQDDPSAVAEADSTSPDTEAGVATATEDQPADDARMAQEETGGGDQDQGAAEQGDHEQADDHPPDTEVASQSAPEQAAGTEPEHEQAEETAPGPEEDPDEDAGPDRVYEDGKEYELTGSPRDGIWISGLPGEAPGTPEGDPYGTVRVGDMLSGPEERKNREDVFADAVSDHLDDINENLDHLDKFLDDIFRDRPHPTHSTAIHDHAPAASPGGGTEHGLDTGHMLSAALVIGVMGVKVHQLIHDRHHAGR